MMLTYTFTTKVQFTIDYTNKRKNVCTHKDNVFENFDTTILRL